MTDVTTILPGTVFAWFMLVLVVRRIILIVILTITRQSQPFKQGQRAPEDNFSKDKNPASIASGENANFDRDTRINKIFSNDAENDTYFVCLLLATAVFSDPTNGNVIRTIAYGSVYAFARIVHSFMYMFGLQPWRSMSYMIGLLCTLAINLDLVITMSRRTN